MKNLKVALFLAFKSIVKGNKSTIVLIILILSLTFVNLLFGGALLNGIITSINKQVATNVVSNIVIEPQEKPVRKDFIVNALELRQQLEKIPGIVATASRYKLLATIAYDKEKNGKFKYIAGEITGINPEDEKKISEIAGKIVAGQYLEDLGEGEILLGSDLTGGYGGYMELASLGGAKVGDKIKVVFNNGIARDYKIKGIFKTEFDYADRQAFITLKEAESVLTVHNSASQILVKTDESGKEDYFINQIRPHIPDLEIRKWIDFVGALGDISKSLNMINLIISVIGLIATALTLFILIYIEVIHKRRQIGILKAIGMKQSIIIYSYIFQALFYTASGIIIGSLLVLYIIKPYFTSHPLKLGIGETSLTINQIGFVYNILILLAAGFIGGVFPSWKAARENILKAIWG